MGFNCGIVGLPNVGKSTIFNALTNVGAASENYPFCTIDPNIGKVEVPDPRLDIIQLHIKTQKVIPASMEFVDIAGLVKGASEDKGRGNKFLDNIRRTDAIAHVVRCFDNDDITHVDGSVDPIRDIEVIETELILSDIASVEKAQKRYKSLSKQDKKAAQILECLNQLANYMNELRPARTFELDDEEPTPEWKKAFHELHLITAKPCFFVCNVDEEYTNDGKENKYTTAVKEYADKIDSYIVKVCGKVEEELSSLETNEKNEFLSELGINEPGLNKLIRLGYKTLGLQTYFTAGEKEVRAWTIHIGDEAPAAAGKIHSDFQRGFICADVYTIEDLEKSQSKAKLKETGKIRMEGRDYVVQDGDIMEFKYNV